MDNTVTSQNIITTIEVDHAARKRLVHRFTQVVTREHQARGDYITNQFTNRQANRMVDAFLDDLFVDHEDTFSCLTAGETVTLPEWSQDRINEAVASAENWYRDMLRSGPIKLPRKRAMAA